MNIDRTQLEKFKTIGLVILLLFLTVLPFSIRHSARITPSSDFALTRGRWRAILSEEREKGRPLYMTSDFMPEKFCPEEWDRFYVLSEIPDGYIMDDMDLVGTWGRDDVALSYTFYVPVDMTDPTPAVKKETAFTFTQSKSELHYIPVASPNKFEELEEGRFYYRDWKGQNLIYWKEDDYLLAVQGDYDNAFLEQIAGYVIEQENPLE